MSDNQYLPPEYQAQLVEAQRRQAMAQMLLQRSMGFQGAQSQGRMAAKTSPLTWMANSLSGYLAQQAGDKASKDVLGVQQRYAGDEVKELERLQGLPEDQRLLQGQRSTFPRAQALAKALQDSRAKRLEMFGQATKEVDPAAAANAAISGQLPGSYQAPAPKPITEAKMSDGTPYLVSAGAKGTTTPHFPPKGTNINMPGNERAAALDITKQQLAQRREGADAAKATYEATTQALDALEKGALAGGGEEVKQALRKTLQTFGITLPGTAETNQLQMALGSAILSEASKIKPISNNDITTLREIVGSIGTDPTALAKALAYSQALAIKGLSTYGEYVDNSLDTLRDDYSRQLFAGAKVGYDVPGQLQGPQSYQMEVVRQLQRQGFDISRLRDMTGQPFPANAQFNINPTSGFPGVARRKAGGTPTQPAPATASAAATPPPADGQAYTLEEFNRYFGKR